VVVERIAPERKVIETPEGKKWMFCSQWDIEQVCMRESGSKLQKWR
jgi:hypothetical protein